MEELFRVVEHLQFRENWKKYERMIPKVVRGFRRIEKLTKEVSKKHDALIEFWINDRRWGVRAIVDAEGMNEKEKLQEIMKAAKALKDFNHRFHPET